MNKMVEIARMDLQNELMKYFILLLIFIGQGVLSIATMLFLPEILESSGFPPDLFPEPTPAMALSEGLENLILLGAIVIALMTMSIFAAEIENGTVYYSLARPVKRYEYVLGKIVARMIPTGIIVALTVVILWGYTGLVFGGEFPVMNVIEAIIPFLLLFLFIIALTSLLSTRLSLVSSGLTTILISAVFFTLPGILHDLAEISPFYLAGRYPDIVTNDFHFLDEPIAVLLALGWIIGLLLATVLSFERRDL